MNHAQKPIKGFSKFSREHHVDFLNEWLGEDLGIPHNFVSCKKVLV